tara:strand:+ start:438 stop:581 length:144 start_codon:yes stop_codon:yes gene_type:complete
MKSLYKCEDCYQEDAIVKDGGIFFCMSCWFKQDNKPVKLVMDVTEKD